MDPELIAKGRAVLPLWALVANVTLLPLLAFATSWLVAFASALLVRRRFERSVHWTLWASESHVPRTHRALSRALLTILFAFSAVPMGTPTGLPYAPSWVAVLVSCAAVQLGYSLGSRPLEKGDPFRGRSAERRRAAYATLLLMVPHVIVIIVAGGLVPSLHAESPRAAMGIAACAALLVVVFSWGYALHLARLLGFVRAPSDRLRSIASRTRTRLGVDFEIFELRGGTLTNALAYPILQTMVFSTEALAILSDDEAVAVALHESGHLAEPKSIRRSRAFISSGLGLAGLGVIIGFVRERDQGEVLPLVVALFGFVVMMLLSRSFRKKSRELEERADATATREEPTAFARALEKIYAHAGLPAVTRNTTVHPSLYDRMLSAGVTPDYPRPPPPRRDWITLPFAAIAVPLLSFGATLVTASLGGSRGQLLASARHGLSAPDLELLAEWNETEGNAVGAEALYAVAVATLDPDAIVHADGRVAALARTGRCEPARHLLELYEGHFSGGGDRKKVSEGRHEVDECFSRRVKASVPPASWFEDPSEAGSGEGKGKKTSFEEDN